MLDAVLCCAGHWRWKVTSVTLEPSRREEKDGFSSSWVDFFQEVAFLLGFEG